MDLSAEVGKGGTSLEVLASLTNVLLFVLDGASSRNATAGLTNATLESHDKMSKRTRY